MRLSFPKWKILFSFLQKESIAIKTDVKMPTLLPSILAQSTTSTKPSRSIWTLGFHYFVSNILQHYKDL